MPILQQKESFDRDKSKGRLLQVDSMQPVSIQTGLSFNWYKNKVVKFLRLQLGLFFALLHFPGKPSEFMSFHLNEAYSELME